MEAGTGMEAGPIKFMLTDVEGSTRLWEEDPESMRLSMARHDQLIREVVEAHGGTLLRERGEGDSSFSVFAEAAPSVQAALELQLALAREPWPERTPIRVRLAIHAGVAEHRDGDYYGSAVNRCARLRAIAHGGQAVMSGAVAEEVAGALPAPMELLDLGIHRLKDLTQPEQIFQLCHPGLPRDFPPLRGLETLPSNLPVQLTSFIGREQEMAELRPLLRQRRLLTLTGTGGSGKTRLALELAAAVLDDFPDGTWFVDLSSISDPALVGPAVLDAVGFPQPSPTDPGAAGEDPAVEVLAREFGSRRVLLVLDNCEHLIDACSRLVGLLLRRCPEVVLLATSRETLAIPGELAWSIPPMALPEPDGERDEIARSDAVQLFLDRARSHHPRLRLDDAALRQAARICARVDGIPLAIELAAAPVQVLGLDQIAARLDDQLRLLTRGARTALTRQQTLRAAIDWSYDRLDADAATLLARTSIFKRGWSIESAETVCVGGGIVADEVLDGLTALVDKSLVQVQDAGPARRFRLLEPIRQYAHEKLVESGEHSALAEAHATWFAGLAERLGGALTGGDQRANLALIDLELENLRAALEWGVSRHRVEGLRTAAALRLFWLYRGLLAEGMQWLEEGLRSAGDKAPPALRAEALMGASRLATETGSLDLAARQVDEARAIAEDLDDDFLVAMALRYQAHLEHDRGQSEAALARLHQALDRARRAGDPYLLRVTILDAAETALAHGSPAEDLLREGIALARAAGDRRNLGVGLSLLARDALATSRLDRAQEVLVEAATMAGDVSDRRLVNEVELLRAQVLLARGEVDAAGDVARACLATAHDLKFGILEAQALEVLAGVEVSRGVAEPAVSLLGEAARLRARIGAGHTRPERLFLEDVEFRLRLLFGGAP